MSIITIVRNAADHIERTVRSVLAQDTRVHEYLVIDGASTDDTLSRLQPFREQLTRVISEPDRGISDAWNKGLALATGDVIGLLNAGDEYAPDAVRQAAAALASQADIVYGDTELVDDTGRVLRRNRGSFSLWRHSGGVGFYHPTLFARRTLYAKVGGFDSGLRYAMDTDWIVRATKAGGRICHAPVRARMLDGGMSVQGRYLAYGEYLQVLHRNGVGRHIIHLSMLNTGLRGLARAALAR